MTATVACEAVARHMRRDFIRAEPNDSLLQAAQVMQLARIRHLPVVLGDRLVGIVSHRDLLEASSSALTTATTKRLHELREISIARIMRTSVCTIAPEAPLREAAEEMLRYKIGCLPVVLHELGCDPRLIGLITESDLLAAAYLPNLDARTLSPTMDAA